MNIYLQKNKYKSYTNETGVVMAVNILEGENDSNVTILTDITKNNQVGSLACLSHDSN